MRRGRLDPAPTTPSTSLLKAFPDILGGLGRGLAVAIGWLPRLHSSLTASASGANGGEPERLLTAQQMEAATQIPSGWFLESARCRSIPFVRLGRYPRFLLSKLIEHGAVTLSTGPAGEWGRKKDKRAAGGAS